jgi:phosphate transport system permease protein
MQNTTLILLLAAMATASFYMGRRRSLVLVGGPARGSKLHSLPGYYGYFTLIWCLLPALGLLLAWLLLEPRVIVALIIRSLPEAQQGMSPGELNLLVNNIQNLAAGDAVSGDINAVLAAAAERYNDYIAASRRMLATFALGVATLGGTYALRRIRPDMRARNSSRRYGSSSRCRLPSSFSGSTGARRSRYAPTRSDRPVVSAPCRCSRARC